jgi:NAD(P)-dependent dehydrogenase (short-subunit alcohol dehydrogenase family)
VNRKKQILVLGGYGGVGRVLSKDLLKFTDSDITIAGRNQGKAIKLATILANDYPDRIIRSAYADVSHKGSLISAFKGNDLIIVTTTTPDMIDQIAEAAIEAGSDMIDILVRGDVVDKLEKYRKGIITGNRVFITQAGFHPGLPAPFIKYGSKKFDNCITANVVMVMNSVFEKAESTYEIIHEIGESTARILRNGVWKKSSWKDALNIQFSEDFGVRKCYPLQMREIYPLAKELGILNMGVYSSGFNWFVDNIVFPLTMLLQSVKKGLGKNTCGKLMHWGVAKFYNGNPGVEFKLIANGIKGGIEGNYVLEAYSSDAFEFTSLAVIACLKQYNDKLINRPGLHLMGNIVDEERFIADLKQMGIQFKEKLS